MALQYKNSLARYRKYLQVVQSQPLFVASLWVILSLLLVILLVVMAIRPTLVTIGGLVGQIKQQQVLAARLDEKIRQVQKAAAELQAARPRLGVVSESLPDFPAWEGLAERWERIAGENGVGLTEVVFEGVPISGVAEEIIKGERINLPQGVKAVRFSVTVTGQYPQIRGWLATLEKTRRLVLIKRLKIIKAEDGTLTAVAEGVSGFMPASESL